MSAQAFLNDLFFPHLGIYILSLVICFLFSFLIFRKKIRSIIDPLLIFVLSWSLANSVAVFLFLCGVVRPDIIIYFILCTLVIAVTYRYAYPDKEKELSFGMKKAISSLDKLMFVFFYFLFLFVTLYKFSINGIPIFNESRFAINIDNSSGMLGLLGRLSGACMGFVIIFAFYYFFNGSKRFSIIVLSSLMVINFLNGSKGFILTFVSWLFFYMLFFEGKRIKFKKKYLIIILISPVIVIITAGMSTGLDSLIYYAYRILAYGDIYWNAYPDNTLNQIHFKSPIENMLYMLWGPFRHIFSFDVSNETMLTGGALIFEKVNGFYPDAGAPNSPVTVMSWIYFRWNGLIMVVVFFSVIAWLFKHIGMKKRTLINVFIQGSILNICFSTHDIYLLFNKTFQLFLFLGMFLLVSMIFNLNGKNE